MARYNNGAQEIRGSLAQHGIFYSHDKHKNERVKVAELAYLALQIIGHVFPETVGISYCS